MPFKKRAVTPVRLNRKRVNKENQFDLDIISNTSLVSAIKQLSNLTMHADSLFEELTVEITTTACNADKLRNRVNNLVESVSTLNAKAVEVPEGDLGQVPGHHVSNNKKKTGSLFTPETRPDCIQTLHKEATENPVHNIHHSYTNCTDGKTESKMLTPLLQEKLCRLLEDSNVEPIAVAEANPTVKNIPEQECRPKSFPGFPEDMARRCSPDSPGLPTPEEKLKLSCCQPVALVPIDITGSGFDRMCEYRESVRSTSREYLEDGTHSLKHKKKRPMVSGDPGSVLDDVSSDVYKMNHQSPAVKISIRSVSHERGKRPKSAALETYAPKPVKSEPGTEGRWTRDKKERWDISYDPEDTNLAQSCSLRRSLKSLFKNKRSKSTDLWAEGRPESPGPPTVDLAAPLKRSQSLPRSLRYVMQNSVPTYNGNRCVSTEGRLDFHTEKALQPECTTSSSKQDKKSGTSPKIPQSVSHNFNLSCSTFVDNLDRPKSMEIGSNTFVGSGTMSQDIPISSSMIPSSTESMASRHTQESNKPNGKHVLVHVPNRPWTKPFARVKLRISKTKETPCQEERQSSSGHWSASNCSARQSLESDFLCSPSSPERLSQCDEDSAMSLNIPVPERFPCKTSGYMKTQLGDGETSAMNGSSSGNESIIDVHYKHTKISTDQWLRSVKMKKGNGRSRTGTTCSTTSQRSNESMLVKGLKGSNLTCKNLQTHDEIHQSLLKGMTHDGDDESSIYFIDKERFYSSMHKAPEQPLEECETTVSENTETNGFLTKHATARSKDEETPLPLPTRLTTISCKGNLEQNKVSKSEESPLTELQKLAALANKMVASKKLLPQTLGKKLERSKSFESIHARVKLKPNTIPSGFPSLCAITPLHSDDEDVEMLSYCGAWKPCVSEEPNFSTMKDTKSLKSSNSAPGTFQDSSTVVSPDAHSLTMLNEKSSKEQTLTWPRTPMHSVTCSVQTSDEVPSLLTPKSLTIQSPNYSLFHADQSFKFLDSRHTIQEVKMADTALNCDRVFLSPTHNTFKTPQEMMTPPKCQGNSFSHTSTMNIISSFNDNNSDASQEIITNTPEKTFDCMATWPRRKKCNFLKRMSCNAIKDDSSIIPNHDGIQASSSLPISNTSKVSQKVDRAHFITCTVSRKVQAPKSLPIDSFDPLKENQIEPQAAHAKLVISSPVANTASFVDNPFKRSVCSPVTADDLLKFWNYSNAEKRYNSLPIKIPHHFEHSRSFSLGQGLKECKEEHSINQIPMFAFVTCPVIENKPTQKQPSKPLYPSIFAMKHSMSYPSKQKPLDSSLSADFTRTWYDGVDASSTLVVMCPDGTSQSTSSKSNFSAFLREHHSRTPKNRRDSNASSISSYSSSSGTKSVTFASVHRANSSSIRRTSLDATSVTSSLISGEMQLSERRSSFGDDAIQVAPKNTEECPIYSTEPIKIPNLKRTNSAGSKDDPACMCPLEIVAGGDNSWQLSKSGEQSFKQHPCYPPGMTAGTNQGSLTVEPNTKKLKMNTAQ